MFISFNHPTTDTNPTVHSNSGPQRKSSCIDISLEKSSSNWPALSCMNTLFLIHWKGESFFPFLFTSNSLDIHCEVCQTFIQSLFFALILKTSIISQTHTCRPGFIVIIHAYHCKKKKDLPPRALSLLDLCQMKAISRHMDTLIYLMESWLPHSVMFSI